MSIKDSDIIYVILIGCYMYNAKLIQFDLVEVQHRFCNQFCVMYGRCIMQQYCSFKDMNIHDEHIYNDITTMDDDSVG